MPSAVVVLVQLASSRWHSSFGPVVSCFVHKKCQCGPALCSVCKRKSASCRRYTPAGHRSMATNRIPPNSKPSPHVNSRSEITSPNALRDSTIFSSETFSGKSCAFTSTLPSSMVIRSLCFFPLHFHFVLFIVIIHDFLCEGQVLDLDERTLFTAMHLLE